jgi:hypothetical protein
MSAVFTSRDIVMSNAPGDNGNRVLCKGSLVTGFKAANIVTGNASGLVTRWARRQMTGSAVCQFPLDRPPNLPVTVT